MNYVKYITIVAISFISAVLLAVVLIPILRKIKFGQTVRDDGPKTHLKKMGVPTMGGMIFLIPIAIISALNSFQNSYIVPLLICTIGFGLVGFADDYIKVVKKRKDGLYANQKTLFQIIVATVFAFYVVNCGIIDNVIHLPGFDIAVPYGVLIGFIVLLLYATTNAVNLTDGVDGLLTSISIIVMMSFIALSLGNPDFEYIRLFCLAAVGALAGYLVFNKYPASVFMGDLGSLALGGAIGGITIMLKSPVILLFFGIIFIAEALSVIIQVTSFRFRGKRVFKMSPIHHHFELSGWKETKVVTVFSIVTLIFCLAGILVYRLM